MAMDDHHEPPTWMAGPPLGVKPLASECQEQPMGAFTDSHVRGPCSATDTLSHLPLQEFAFPDEELLSECLGFSDGHRWAVFFFGAEKETTLDDC